MTPDRVQSYAYTIGTVAPEPGVLEAIDKSPHDLVVTGYDITLNPPALNRAVADPTNNKIILSYLAVPVASHYLQPDLLPTTSTPASAVPTWFGKEDPQYPGSYSVQYWDPRWEPYLFALIDRYIAEVTEGTSRAWAVSFEKGEAEADERRSVHALRFVRGG